MVRAGDWKSRVKIKPRSAPTSTRGISASTVQAASRPTSGAYYLLRVAPRGLRQPKDHPEHHRGRGHRAAVPQKDVGMLIEVVTKTHGPAFIAPITTKVGRAKALSPQSMSSGRRQVPSSAGKIRDAKNIVLRRCMLPATDPVPVALPGWPGPAARTPIQALSRRVAIRLIHV